MKAVYHIENYSVIILAAGQSSRLGQPKQLLPYRGKTLLQHTIENALRIDAESVLVILGANNSLIRKEITYPNISIIENPYWESGIASSIKLGLNALLNMNPKTDAILLMVCDQPFIESAVLQRLLDAQNNTGQPIIGSSYDNTYGIPALFHSTLFPDLMELNGDHGAKKLFDKYKHQSFFVPFDKGGIDIDTDEDYEKLAK
jgi:molybdenum cofactor cytidylyltransferase